jgi:hypothetical protein
MYSTGSSISSLGMTAIPADDYSVLYMRTKRVIPTYIHTRHS